MTALFEVLKYTLPGLIVFLTAYLLIKAFFDQEKQNKMLEIKVNNQKQLTPIRLQAYERLTLFLERISPDSMLVRLHVPDMQSHQLHREMLSLIRAEFEHNLAQQLYVSPEAWQIIRSAKENTIKIINMAAEKVQATAPAIELSQKILETMMGTTNPTQPAIDFIKKEASRLF